ncbi:MAG: hypothetical protein JRN20_12890 [Nitrososphaerota archaeon]|nr:hypothetical protein [Nitrososphaerota archaeon]
MSLIDSRQRFVIVYSAISLLALTVLAFLNTNDLGVYVSSFAIIYFALRLIFNPKLRTRLDILGLVLLVFFAYYVAERVLSILGVH